MTTTVKQYEDNIRFRLLETERLRKQLNHIESDPGGNWSLAYGGLIIDNSSAANAAIVEVLSEKIREQERMLVLLCKSLVDEYYQPVEQDQTDNEGAPMDQGIEDEGDGCET